MTDLFAGATLGLVLAYEDDPYARPLPLRLDGEGLSDRPIQFGPFKSSNVVQGWQIVSGEGVTLDAGEICPSRIARRVTTGDRVVFERGDIKSVTAGDLLGITAVFMPSGFVAGVAPVVVPGGSDLGAGLSESPYALFPYPEQQQLREPWWLPKRAWVDPLPGGWVPDWEKLAALWGWQKRLGTHETWCRPVVKRRQQELVAAGVI